ncbi:MAG: hypothetical protein O3C43_20235 [Verrucomicrobia bacterium]|nr:hypothetical protein [Verrucomicrobiota bacterium]
MKSSIGMRELGKLKDSPIIRFGRNQRRAALVAPRSGEPFGIQRFRTWEEVEEWEKNRQKKKK